MNALRAYLAGLPSTAERSAFAEKCGTTIGHMRNASYEFKELAPAVCVRAEANSRGAIRRWHLRPNDWHLIWPELIGVSGAPKLRRSKSAAEAQ